MIKTITEALIRINELENIYENSKNKDLLKLEAAIILHKIAIKEYIDDTKKINFFDRIIIRKG